MAGKFSKDPSNEVEYGKTPPVCGKTGCNNYTDVAIAVAMRPNGTYISGAMSDVVRGNQFIEWVSRCSGCYVDDIINHKGIDYSPISIPSNEMTKEQVDEARRHFLDVAKKFIVGYGVKRTKKNIDSGKWTKEMESKFKQKAVSIGIEIL